MRTNNHSNIVNFERQVAHLVFLGKRDALEEAKRTCKGLAGDQLKAAVGQIAHNQLTLAKTTVTRQAGNTFKLESNSEPVQKALNSIDQTFASLQDELITTLGKQGHTEGGIRV